MEPSAGFYSPRPFSCPLRFGKTVGRHRNGRTVGGRPHREVGLFHIAAPIFRKTASPPLPGKSVCDIVVRKALNKSTHGSASEISSEKQRAVGIPAGFNLFGRGSAHIKAIGIIPGKLPVGPDVLIGASTSSRPVGTPARRLPAILALAVILSVLPHFYNGS